MNTPQRTRTLRAALAIYGARSARQHIARTAAIGRQLDLIAPGTVEVRTAPVTTGTQRRTWVELTDVLGLPLGDRDAHRAAGRLLMHMFPRADWSAPQRYTVDTGHLTPDAPTAPAELGIDTAEATR